MDTDAILLERYARGRDPAAFAEMVRRHARMVFAVAFRATGNPQDAEDIAQQCFMDLARQAGRIKQSLSGWLHSAATHRASNLRRDMATRKHHEQQAVPASAGGQDPTWAELAPQVDAAIDRLPDELRVPLVMHYLESRSQSDVAEVLGLSQPTVSRRIEKGVEVLREELGMLGLAIPVGALALLLTEKTTEAMPASLTAALGKMAVAGVGAAAPPLTMTKGVAGVMRLLFPLVPWTVLLIAVVAPLYWLLPTRDENTAGQASKNTPPTAGTQPARAMLRKITQVRLDQDMALLLTDDQERCLVVIIGQAQGLCIKPWLSGTGSLDDGYTHSAVVRALRSYASEVTRVAITQLTGGTFSADLQVRSGNEARELDCRPSDGLNLAVRTGAPIWVDDAMMVAAAQRRPDGHFMTPQEVDEQRRRTRTVATPVDKTAKLPDRAVPLPTAESFVQQKLLPGANARPLVAVRTVSIRRSDADGEASVVLSLEGGDTIAVPVQPEDVTSVCQSLDPAWSSSPAWPARPQVGQMVCSVLAVSGIRVEAVLLSGTDKGFGGTIFLTDGRRRTEQQLPGLDALCIALRARRPLLIDADLAATWRR